MWRLVVTSILTAANTLLNRNETQENNSTSKWRSIANFLLSTLNAIGVPFVRTLTENETVYECVNTLLSNSTTTTTRNGNNNRQQTNSNLSRFSRPHFRRRSHHENRTVRIIKPTIHIHIHH